MQVDKDSDYRDPQVVLARATKAHNQLSQVHVGLASVHDRVQAIAASGMRKQRLEVLGDARYSLDELRKLRVNGTGRLIQAAMNEITSAREAVYVALAKSPRLDFSTLAAAVQEVSSMIDAQKQRMSSAVQSAAASSEIEDANDVFHRVATEAPKVELGNKPYSLYRVPVVAVSSPPLSPDKLRTNGIKAEPAHGYTVIHNQVVLGISMQRAAEKGEKPLDVAQRLIKMLSRQTGRRLMLVEQQSYGYRHASYYWLADEATLNAMRRSSINQSAPVFSSWGFAFN